ncbi:hypothetical protein [Prevotella jejuni]
MFLSEEFSRTYDDDGVSDILLWSNACRAKLAEVIVSKVRPWL